MCNNHLILTEALLSPRTHEAPELREVMGWVYDPTVRTELGWDSDPLGAESVGRLQAWQGSQTSSTPALCHSQRAPQRLDPLTHNSGVS